MMLVTRSIALATATLGFAVLQEDTPQESTNLAAQTDVLETPAVTIPAPVVATPESRAIDLALCLDTSGSMQGLIESAKQRLWTLVNDLALAEPTPRLRVALLTYGTPTNGEENGYVKIQVPLTEDLDMVSMKLFELTTSGGDEYVSRVTQKAAMELPWSPESKAIKMIVVAGNETAEQDPLVTLEKACGQAIQKGIVVHSLYCAQGGQYAQQRAQGLSNSVATSTPVSPNSQTGTTVVAAPMDPIAQSWKKVAQLADGAFAMIDQNSGVVVIETPMDQELAALSTALNDTYIPYGSDSRWNLSNQCAQDVNAATMNGEAAASRAVAKAGKLYVCGWDLIDAIAQETVKLEDVERDQLPEELREKTDEELKAHIDTLKAKRKETQDKILALNEKREVWLANKRNELGTDESTSFDTPLRKAIRELTLARGFRFPAPKSVAVSEETGADTGGSDSADTGSTAETAPVTEFSKQHEEGRFW